MGSLRLTPLLLALFLGVVLPNIGSANSEDESCFTRYARIISDLVPRIGPDPLAPWRAVARDHGFPEDAAIVMQALMSPKTMPRAQIQEAIRYLIRRRDLTAAARANLFQRFAEFSIQKNPMLSWQAIPMQGSDGSPVAYGPGGFVLVFRGDGKILKGQDGELGYRSPQRGDVINLEELYLRELDSNY